MNTYFFSATRSVALSFSSLLSWLLSAQLGWRKSGWGRGGSLCQGQCDMFWLFTYTLIQVLIMFVLSARKKREGKSEKPQTEFIRNNSLHWPFRKNKCCLHTSTHAHTHTQTPQLPRTNTSYIYLDTYTAEDKFKASQQPPNLAPTPSYWHTDWHTWTQPPPHSFHLQHSKALGADP